MGVIHRLPFDLANQIAAGEVVERPSSVVKELLENAVDAGASRIEIEVEGGGIGLVRVSDDGIGMSPEDAVLALERHATSKISVLDDLSRIQTYGFRGEALPSIASVSRFSLRTRRRDDEVGTEVVVDGGGAPRVLATGRAQGTTIEVRDLFFNVPARRKFLRSLATESAHITEVAESLALAAPKLSVILTREGRTAREWLRVETREERVHTAFGGEVLAPCRGERGPVSVEAFLARPERARAATSALTLLVNGRTIRDRALLRAVAQAYGSVLEPGRYPVGVVYLDLDPNLLDVNVHPQKAEVRFADGRAVGEALFRILADALSRAFGMPVAVRTWGRPERADPVNRFIGTGMEAAREVESSPFPWAFSSPSAESVTPPETTAPKPYPLLETRAGERTSFSRLSFVAQLRQTFLLCEGPDGIYLLDQHAAAERVTFDRLRRAYAGRDVATQTLLFPVVIEVTAADAAFVEEEHELLARLGLDLRGIGPTTLAVHAIPQLLSRAKPEVVVRDLIAELTRSGGRAFSDAIDLVLATMACHGSVRAGDRMSSSEATALLIALDQVDFSGHCPHGRPIVTRIGWDELERKVLRR